MRSISESIIGEFPAEGYVEALMTVRDGPSLRVCVNIPEFGRTSALDHAEVVFPALVLDIPAVEALAAKITSSSTPSVVLDIWVKPDGAASYTCGFLDGELEDTLVSISRDAVGHLEPLRA